MGSGAHGVRHAVCGLGFGDSGSPAILGLGAMLTGLQPIILGLSRVIYHPSLLC